MYFTKAVALTAFAGAAQAAVTAQQMVSNIDAITDLSSQTNDVAKSISVTNFFQTTPQMISNFRDIIQTASNDYNAMQNKKRSIAAKRQECLNVEDVEKCIEDLMEIIEDPSEILGDKRSLDAVKRQECLNAEDVEKCIEDLQEIIEDPSEILGDKRSFIGSPAARSVARRQSTSYSEADQQAICSSFRGLLATVIGKHGLLSLTPFTQPIGSVLRTLEAGVDTLAFGIIDSVPSCAQDATENKNNLDGTLVKAIDEYSS